MHVQSKLFAAVGERSKTKAKAPLTSLSAPNTTKPVTDKNTSTHLPATVSITPRGLAYATVRRVDAPIKHTRPRRRHRRSSSPSNRDGLSEARSRSSSPHKKSDSDIKFPRAIRSSDGQVVEAANQAHQPRNTDSYTCPECTQVLYLRYKPNGTRRAHFAHAPNANCSASNESLDHYYAKRFFAQHYTKFRITRTCRRKHDVLMPAFPPESKSKIEHTIEKYRIDVAILLGEHDTLHSAVEILKTNQVSFDKRKELVRLTNDRLFELRADDVFQAVDTMKWEVCDVHPISADICKECQEIHARELETRKAAEIAKKQQQAKELEQRRVRELAEEQKSLTRRLQYEHQTLDRELKTLTTTRNLHDRNPAYALSALKLYEERWRCGEQFYKEAERYIGECCKCYKSFYKGRDDWKTYCRSWLCTDKRSSFRSEKAPSIDELRTAINSVQSQVDSLRNQLESVAKGFSAFTSLQDRVQLVEQMQRTISVCADCHGHYPKFPAGRFRCHECTIISQAGAETRCHDCGSTYETSRMLLDGTRFFCDNCRHLCETDGCMNLARLMFQFCYKCHRSKHPMK